jgi:hypothetical protein
MGRDSDEEEKKDLFIMPTHGAKLGEVAKPIKLTKFYSMKAAERKQKDAIRDYEC